jgi:hypothetical protein
MSKGYNGWSNYETWRINLEMLDGMTPEDFGIDLSDDFANETHMVEALSEAVEGHVGYIIEEQAEGFALDLANSFLARVDWAEIAEHMIEDAIAELV